MSSAKNGKRATSAMNEGKEIREWRVGMDSGQGYYVLAENPRQALSGAVPKEDLPRVTSVILWKVGADYADFGLTDGARRFRGE